MKWNYKKRYEDISTHRCVKEDLHQFGHETPKKPHNHPHIAPERTYGADAQKMKPLDTSAALATWRL